MCDDVSKKICSRCGVEKELDNFRFRKDRNIYDTWCKWCNKEYKIQYKIKGNKEKNIKTRHVLQDQNKKYCARCDQELDFSSFGIKKNGKYYTWCRLCCSENTRKYYKKSDRVPLTEEERKERRKESSLKYAHKNKVEITEEDRKQDREYYHKNSKTINKRRANRNKKRKIEDIFFKLRSQISISIAHYLKKQDSSKNGESCLKKLPQPIQELTQYIESSFDWWMTWKNNGIYNPKTWDDNDPSTWTWQLDHIIPHSFFKYTSMDSEEFRQCWALENLRPLSAKENLLKGNKIDKEVFDKLYPILVEKAKNV
jgi:hypothetical protein